MVISMHSEGSLWTLVTIASVTGNVHQRKVDTARFSASL